MVKKVPFDKLKKNDSRFEHMSHVHDSRNGIPHGHQSEWDQTNFWLSHSFFKFVCLPVRFGLAKRRLHFVYENAKKDNGFKRNQK